MTVLRFILAVLIGFSLAVTPVAGAMAKPMAAMEHCDKQGMDAKDMGDCPCCAKGSACTANSCASVCVKVPVALTTTAFQTLVFLRQMYEPASTESVALHSWPPPAPPPRA